MANSEVDKIRDLKLRKDEEEKKVENRKEEKLKKEARVVELDGEIKNLIAQNEQHHELDEEVELKKLREQLDELQIQSDDQRDKLEMHRAKHQSLKNEYNSVESTVAKCNAEIKEKEAQITDAQT